MGNCVFKGYYGAAVEEESEMVKVVTANGGIMELLPPITAECITYQFPGHAIYNTHQPLLHNDHLHPGKLYYLLPHKTTATPAAAADDDKRNVVSGGYRMSLDKQRTTSAEVFPRYNNDGVWKVKLVMRTEQLAEILAQEGRTEELIESVRTVSKFGNKYKNNNYANSLANSDQCNVCSSLKLGSSSSDKYGVDSEKIWVHTMYPLLSTS